MLAFDSAARYQTIRVGLGAHDTVILYTDGLTEAARNQDEFFGDDRLYECLPELAATGCRLPPA